MSVQTKPVYVFGAFRYDAQQRLLFRDGALVPLVPKAADTLQVLLENRGRMVEKSELMRLVWPDTVVEDVGLARNISLLRKVLGGEADSESDSYVETIPRRGYRFVADVRLADSKSAEAQSENTPWRINRLRFTAGVIVVWIIAAVIYLQFYKQSRYLPSGSGYATLAVIPFECLSPELDCGKFSKSFSDITVARLSTLDAVHVISPSTVQRYQRARISPSWMGRMLGLEVLLEGSVQHIGDRVRITARLGDIHSGKVIWSETYDYPAAELDRAESEAARGIAEQVGAHLRTRTTPAVSH
jgi:DNA-binding winged helix-turn-helix (wHTH) protein/TolB-like protein